MSWVIEKVPTSIIFKLEDLKQSRLEASNCKRGTEKSFFKGRRRCGGAENLGGLHAAGVELCA